MAFIHLPTTSSPALLAPIRAASFSLSLPVPPSLTQNSTNFSNWVRSKSLNFVFSGALTLGLSLAGVGIAEAKVGVNKLELKKNMDPTSVINAETHYLRREDRVLLLKY